tara:strand:+ start:108 stop:797 length:690 start_codon:yes stop_codon:yes gene_type:complete
MISKRVIVALDNNNLKETLLIVSSLKKEVHSFKIGYEFFFNFGIEGYKKIKKICPNIFLDLKLHDIPNTVKNGLIAINKLKPLLTTIHISGGDYMLKSSIFKNSFTKIIGVSILTSLDSTQTKKYYNQNKIDILVKDFAKQARKHNLDGIVCSPKEISLVRKQVGKNFLIITPGIRLSTKNEKNDDQKRILTPVDAISLGADLLVIGRPITGSKNPLKTLNAINNSISK